ncbi:V-type proton ATPase subunit H-like [Henckelia pumila]|uniref:V-type proton ATPase subunit H-like n=1 Tax=Henckelia pumila TaxID=405737 RepID=UPI003C6DCE6B
MSSGICMSFILSGRPKGQDNAIADSAAKSKNEVTSINDVLKGLVDWLCAQLKNQSHAGRSIPVAINCLSTLLKEPTMRSSFVQADGVKLLIPLISPASVLNNPSSSFMKLAFVFGSCLTMNLRLSTWLLLNACHG